MTATESITKPAEDALYERVRFLLFSADLPVQRLAADIRDIERFTGPRVSSSHRRLVESMPALKPASEAIVRAMIQAYHEELFGRSSANLGLKALIKAGPVRFGQTALTLGPDAPIPTERRPLVDEFNRIFERYPESGFAEARKILLAIGLPVSGGLRRQPRSGRRCG
jgi:hypothetical protein